MKKILLSLGFFALAISGAYAQVGIGTLTPDKSAQLDITATDKGVLIPRITLTSTTQKLSSVANAKSLLIFSGEFTENSKTYPEGYYYWDGTKWVAIISDTEAGLKTLLKHLNTSTAGSVTYSSTTNTFDVKAENGIKVHDGKVKLGGALTGNTEIDLNGNTLGLKGVTVQADAYELMVLDGSGNIKKITKLKSTDLTGGTDGTNGQVVATDGAGNLTWVSLPANVSPSTLQTGGDISGSLDNVTVNKIKNQPVTKGTTDGQVLVFNGTAWVPGKLQDKSLDLSNINLAGEVTGPLDATKVTKLGGKSIELGTPAAGNVLTFEGDKWIAKAPATVNANNLDGKQNLTLGNGLEFPTGTNGNEAVLKAVTINVKASDGIKVDGSGISVNVKDKSGLKLVDNGASGKQLVVEAGNGVKITDDGKVGLGGNLEKDTEIITDTGKGLTIKGAGTDGANVTIDGLKEKTELDPKKDKIIVVGDDGKLTKVDPNLIGKTDYKKDEVDTGKKWTDNKKVYQKVFDVTFNSATYAEAGTNIPDGATVISIRLVGQGNGQEVFSSARYVKGYNAGGVTGNLIFAVYGGMAWTLNGAYTVIVEYAR